MGSLAWHCSLYYLFVYYVYSDYNYFVVYFLWLVAKPWLARYMRRKMQQKVNDMFRQSFGGAQAQVFPLARRAILVSSSRVSVRNPARPPRRRFSVVTKASTSTLRKSRSVPATPPPLSGLSHRQACLIPPREPQITDAEWEEV